MTDTLKPLTSAALADLKAKAKAATPGPWCAESCGEKGDGSNIIGVAFEADDQDCKKPLSGWLRAFDDAGNEIDYYRDQEVAQIEHRADNPGHNTDFVIAANPETILRLIAMIERRDEQIEKLRGAMVHFRKMGFEKAREALAATEPPK